MRTLLFIVALFFATNGFAQMQIKGVVTDSQNNPLPGASVTINNTNIGTITNNDGSFSLNISQPGIITLKTSFIGYQTNIQKINPQKDSSLKIQLEEKSIYTENVFVYATRAKSNTPVTNTNISKQQIEERNMGQDIAYLLNTTPSFVATSDAGTGVGYTGFRIRGTDANRINVTINGIPVNDAESHSVYWVNMPDFSSSIENIQVQRGVGTSTQGAAAFGATINMQTSTLQKDAYAEYNGSGGSYNTFKNTVRAGTGLLNDHFAVDVRLSKISSDGFIDRAFADLKSFYVSGGYYSANTIVKLNIFSGKEYTYQAWNGVPSVRLNNDLEGMQRYGDHWLYSAKETEEMIAADESPRTYNLYTYDNETDNYQQDHYQLMFSHRFSDALNMNAALHYTYGSGYYEQYKAGEDFEDYQLNNLVVGNDTLTSTDLIRQKWLDNDFYGATFSLNYDKNRSDFTLGGGWNRYDGRHFGNVIWAEYATNHEKDYEWYRNTGQKTDFNVYAKYNYALTPAFNLYADVQYRNIQYTIEGIDDDLRDLTNRHPFSFVNPKFGVYYQPSNNLKAYVSYAVGHREPSRSTFTDTDPDQPTPTAEQLKDFEGGITFSQPRFSVGANLYYMDYKDQLIMTGEINDIGTAVFKNAEDSYRAGVELIAGVQITHDLKWDVNATFSQNKILNFTEYVDNWDEGGQTAFDHGTTDIAFSPSVVANSQLGYTPLKNLELALISQYVGDQHIDNSANENRKLDAYFVNNLKAAYTIYPGFFDEVEFSLLVNNLLNEVYETNAWVYSYILGGERYKMDGYFPQAGTNFLVGVNIRF
ncbi:MAG: TonB-dependent receptor [Prolixibacteraceae bacterium]|nr:TonB-dependent receptor [Prolixibacteraceae bacterium]MBN2649678.1 TonB-dependent receptor [Prolixibacteraceae bacterium]